MHLFWYNIMKFYPQKAGSHMKILTRVLTAVISLILILLLIGTTVSSSLISCVRARFTPRFIYSVMSDIDYASLEIPDENGNNAPLRDTLNRQARDFGIHFTDDDINLLFRAFSIDAVLTSYIQDVRSWALDDGPTPMIDADETAAIILKGLDQSLYSLLAMFGDPAQALAGALKAISSSPALMAAFERGEILQKLLAFDFMIFIISISAVLFLLLVVVHRLRFISAAIRTGFACMVSGIILYFIYPITEAILSAVQYPDLLASVPGFFTDGVIIPLVDTAQRTGIVISLGGLAAVTAFAVIGWICSMLERKNTEVYVYPCSQDTSYPQFDGMTEEFSSEASDADGANCDESAVINHNDTDY